MSDEKEWSEESLGRQFDRWRAARRRLISLEADVSDEKDQEQWSEESLGAVFEHVGRAMGVHLKKAPVMLKAIDNTGRQVIQLEAALAALTERIEQVESRQAAQLLHGWPAALPPTPAQEADVARITAEAEQRIRSESDSRKERIKRFLSYGPFRPVPHGAGDLIATEGGRHFLGTYDKNERDLVIWALNELHDILSRTRL